ncbi:MAG: LamB/YcsF family protein [Lachnospiraceae bacterium]
MLEIDLNCDLGESFGAYTIGMDEAVIPFITSANVACGFHAGDPVIMEKTVVLCRRHQVSIGAHPGFPDLIGFGRRNMQAAPDEVRAYVIYQTGAMKAFCEAAGMRLNHVKPHGALYNMAGSDYQLARAICEAVKVVDPSLTLLALSGSQMIRAAKDIGLACASEVFADRAYQSDGSLVPRGQEGAMITDEEQAVGRIIRMVKEGMVTAVDGTDIAIRADSVCVHGDGASALEFVKRIRASLAAAGIEVKSPASAVT